jgi:membrane protease YdiL (CAAX protease family)
MSALKPAEFQFIVSLACVLIAFTTFWFGVYQRWNKEEKNQTASKLFPRRVLGFVILGLVPLLIMIYATPMSMENLGIRLSIDSESALWIGGSTILIVLISFFSAGSEDNLKANPQTREREWNYLTFIKEFGGWGIYLLGYEILFRGVLLFGSLQLLDTPAAIVLNIIIYSLSHFPKGFKESIGAIVMGTVVCIATIRTGTIWAAFFIHWIFAATHTYFSFRAHPQMTFSSS